MNNYMKLEISALGENESFARSAVAAFALYLNPSLIELSDIKTVVSHPQALAQCGVYLQSKGWQTMEYSNTALAAKYVKETGDGSIAAIASDTVPI